MSAIPRTSSPPELQDRANCWSLTNCCPHRSLIHCQYMSVQIVHVLGCGTACIVFVDSWETWHKTAKQMLIQGFMCWYILSRCFVWFNEDTDVPSIPEMPAPNTTALGPDFSRGQTQKYFDHTQVRCPESGRTSRVLDPRKTSSGGFNSMTCCDKFAPLQQRGTVSAE